MKLLVILALAAVASAAPQSGDLRSSQDAQLVRYDSDSDGISFFKFLFEQDDGQKREEEGELRNAGTDEESIAVKGSYSWVGPDGVTYIVNYVADENGFQPTIEQGPGGAVPPGVVASLLG